jgi:hypothetical protein
MYDDHTGWLDSDDYRRAADAKINAINAGEVTAPTGIPHEPTHARGLSSELLGGRSEDGNPPALGRLL